MKKQNIKTIEMTRRIRDAHYKQLKCKTRQERIAFYRNKAKRLHQNVKALK
ncbi:hypothetical protein GMMP15_810026 [Candidatus Magnetomoraceae bacterium gMMP-15]